MKGLPPAAWLGAGLNLRGRVQNWMHSAVAAAPPFPSLHAWVRSSPGSPLQIHLQLYEYDDAAAAAAFA